MVVISEQEFDTVVMGIALVLAAMTTMEDENDKEQAAALVMRGLALIKAGVFL